MPSTVPGPPVTSCRRLHCPRLQDTASTTVCEQGKLTPGPAVLNTVSCWSRGDICPGRGCCGCSPAWCAGLGGSCSIAPRSCSRMSSTSHSVGPSPRFWMRFLMFCFILSMITPKSLPKQLAERMMATMTGDSTDSPGSRYPTSCALSRARSTTFLRRKSSYNPECRLAL